MSKKLIFKKMQGLGNDFILIDSKENQEWYTDGKFNLSKPELAMLAHRHYGVGCDQILLVEPSSTDTADFDYLIYNQDGSGAAYCGNGARCVVKYLLDKYYITTSVTLNTHGRLTRGDIASKDQITINMGQPDFKPESSGYTGTSSEYNNYSHLVGGKLISFGIVSMGNPHAIIALESIAKLSATEQLTEIGKVIQNSNLFNDGVNINFFVVDNAHQIHLRTYERGVGFTLSCGSGACATAAFAIANNMCSTNVTIHMTGGNLQVHWDKVNEMEMTGNAAYVFDGTISL